MIPRTIHSRARGASAKARQTVPHAALTPRSRSRRRRVGQGHKRDPVQVRHDIEDLLQQKAFAPGGGLLGVPMVNVLELNLELRKRYGESAGAAT